MPRVSANGIEIEYDEMGAKGDPAIVLVMGFSGQMTRWPEAFKRGLADAGHRVIWFDNRDIGLTTEINAPAPSFPDIIGRLTSGEPATDLVPYTLDDMAADTAALIDALDAAPAHVLGVSMGGMIVQLLALDHRDKVRSLIPVMTTSGDPALPPGSPEAMQALTATPKSRAVEHVTETALAAAHAIGSHPDLRTPDEEVRARVARDVARSDRPEGVGRQYAAILAQPRWHERLSGLDVPTLVLHGAVDPLIRPACGEDIAKRTPGAAFQAFEKWGHDIPDSMIQPLLDRIIPFLRAA